MIDYLMMSVAGGWGVEHRGLKCGFAGHEAVSFASLLAYEPISLMSSWLGG